MSEFYIHHPQHLQREKAPPPPLDEERIKLENETYLTYITHTSPDEAREQIILDTCIEGISEELIEYIRKNHSTLYDEEKIQAFKDLATADPEAAMDYLFKFTPHTFAHQNTRFAYLTTIRQDGYAADLPDPQQRIAVRRKIFDEHKNDAADEAKDFRLATFTTEEKMYYDYWIKNGNPKKPWDSFSPDELTLTRDRIKEGVAQGTMPYHVREFLAICRFDFLSPELIEELEHGAPNKPLPHPETSHDLSTTEENARSTRAERFENLKKYVRADEDDNVSREVIALEILRTISNGTVSIQDVENDPSLNAYGPFREDAEEVKKINQENDQRLMAALDQANMQNFSDFFKFTGKKYDFIAPTKIWGGTAVVARQINTLLRHAWPYMIRQPHFFKGSEKMLAGFLKYIPTLERRSRLPDMVASLYQHDQLTPEVLTAFLERYDDSFLLELWDATENDPAYLDILGGRLADTAKKEQLFEAAGRETVTTGQEAGIYRSLRALQLSTVRLEQLMAAEPAPDTAACTQEMQEIEKNLNYLQQEWPKIETMVKERPHFFLDGMLKTVDHDFIRDISELIETRHESLRERAISLVTTYIDAVPVGLIDSAELQSYSECLSALLVRGTPEHKFNAENRLRSRLENAGIATTSDRLLAAWKKSASDQTKPRVMKEKIAENILQILTLEESAPGAVDTLVKDFGVKVFARYEQEMLRRQVEQKDKRNVRFVTVVFPGDDWNAAFYHDKDILNKLSQELEAHGITLRLYEASTVNELVHHGINMRRKYREADAAIIGGHGTEGEIAFGNSKDGDDPSLTKAMFDHPLAKRTGRWLKQGAPILLFSCSTGAQNGIAQKMSETYDHVTRVVGPEIPTAPREIRILSIDPLDFEVAYYEEGTERIYQQGAVRSAS